MTVSNSSLGFSYGIVKRLVVTVAPYFARLGDFATWRELIRSNQPFSRKDAKAQSFAKANQGTTVVTKM